MKLLKNPIFWGLVFIVLGGIVGAWGWDKHESTIATRTAGSVPMMIVGVAWIVVGIVIWFTKGRRK